MNQAYSVVHILSIDALMADQKDSTAVFALLAFA